MDQIGVDLAGCGGSDGTRRNQKEHRGVPADLLRGGAASATLGNACLVSEGHHTGGGRFSSQQRIGSSLVRPHYASSMIRSGPRERLRATTDLALKHEQSEGSRAS